MIKKESYSSPCTVVLEIAVPGPICTSGTFSVETFDTSAYNNEFSDETLY